MLSNLKIGMQELSFIKKEGMTSEQASFLDSFLKDEQLKEAEKYRVDKDMQQVSDRLKTIPSAD